MALKLGGGGRPIVVVVGADDKATNVIEKVKLGLKDVDRQAKRSDTSWRSVKGSIQGAAIAVGTLTAAIVKVTAAYAEQEKVERRLQAVLSGRGADVQASSEHLLNYASALQRVSIYGDEAIIPVQQLLIQMGGLSGPILDRATAATLDLASALGMDLSSAATLVAKAAGGYASALSRYGIIVDRSKTESEQFAEALDQINQKFGGTAASDVDTFSGAVDQLKNQMGDLAEEVGGMNTGPLTVAVRKWTEWADAATDAIARVNDASGDSSLLALQQQNLAKLRDETDLLNDQWTELFNSRVPARESQLAANEARRNELLKEQQTIMRSIELMEKGVIAGAPEKKDAPGSAIIPDPTGGGGDDKTPSPDKLIDNYVNAQAKAWDAMQEIEIQKGVEFLELQQTNEATRIAQIAEYYDLEQAMAIAQGEKLIALQIARTAAEREQTLQRVEAVRMGFEAVATAFPNMKAAAIAEATVRGGVAFMNALSVQPWYVGLAMAAIAAAKTKAAIDNIKKTGIRTGGGTGSYSYGGATGTVPAIAAVTPVTDVTLNVRGDGLTNETALGDLMVGTLDEFLAASGGNLGKVTVNVTQN